MDNLKQQMDGGHHFSVWPLEVWQSLQGPTLRTKSLQKITTSLLHILIMSPHISHSLFLLEETNVCTPKVGESSIWGLHTTSDDRKCWFDHGWLHWH